MAEQFSKMVKAGKITYFIDVKEAKNQSKYLQITSSQPTGPGSKKFTKRSIIVFKDSAAELQDALQEAILQLQ